MIDSSGGTVSGVTQTNLRLLGPAVLAGSGNAAALQSRYTQLGLWLWLWLWRCTGRGCGCARGGK